MPARLACGVAVVMVATLAGEAIHVSADAPSGPPVVIVDTDMDFDDAAAIAYLAEADKLGLIDLRAVTVSISGIAFPGNGISHARCLLDKVGLSDVPVADGDRITANNFPEFARFILDDIVETGVRSDAATPCPTVPSDGAAADLLTSAIRSAPRGVTLITLGPLTNVAQAFEGDPTLAKKIGRVFLMGGCLSCPPATSDLDTDFNIWVDAPAAAAVLHALPARIFMTSGEATDHVPLTSAFRERLAVDRSTPAAETVSAMASHPILVGGEDQGLAFWWDPLDAVAATFGGIASYRPQRIDVDQTQGRVVVDDDGPLVHYGTSARTDRFEQTFLDILNARHP